jgi:probable rRNA maturation factor
MLHLAGHDHEADRGQMQKLEMRLRAELNLPAGLIERAAERAASPGNKVPRASRRRSG